MTYYLLLPGDSEEDAYFDSNILGEDSFGTFYPSQGLKLLMTIVDEKPDLLPSIKILTEQKKVLELTEFLSILDKLNIMF